MSSIIPTPTSANTTDTDSPDATATPSPLPASPKPITSYVYPSIALVVFALVVIHACRFFERRRHRRERALLGPAAELGFGRGELVKPIIHSVHLSEPDAEKPPSSWQDITPLSATIVRAPDPREIDMHKAGRPEPALNNVQLVMESVRSFARSAMPDYRQPSLQPTVPPPPPDLPADLVTGVLIAMPDAASPTYRPSTGTAGKTLSWPDDQLPNVVLGSVERPWSDPPILTHPPPTAVAA